MGVGFYLLFFVNILYSSPLIANSKTYNNIDIRGVAQSGSAPHWGCGGRQFESGRPDHY